MRLPSLRSTNSTLTSLEPLSVTSVEPLSVFPGPSRYLTAPLLENESSIRTQSTLYLSSVSKEEDLDVKLEVFSSVFTGPTVDFKIIEKMLNNTESRDHVYGQIGRGEANQALASLIELCDNAELVSILTILRQNTPERPFSTNVWAIANLLLIFDGTGMMETTLVLSEFHSVLLQLVGDRFAVSTMRTIAEMNPERAISHATEFAELTSRMDIREDALASRTLVTSDEARKIVQEQMFSLTSKKMFGGALAALLLASYSSPEMLGILKAIVKPALESVSFLASQNGPPPIGSSSAIAGVVKDSDPTTYMVITKAYSVFIKFCWKYLTES